MGTAASVKEVSGNTEASGVIPRSIKSIFATMQQARADYDVNMKVLPAFTQMYLLLAWLNCSIVSAATDMVACWMLHIAVCIKAELYTYMLAVRAVCRCRGSHCVILWHKNFLSVFSLSVSSIPAMLTGGLC